MFGYNGWAVNFGQRSWTHEPPSGYKSLSTNNLPDPLVKPKKNFSAVTYTGNGGNLTVDGVGFSAGLTWLKNRDTARNHNLTDTVRGVNKYLSSDTTDEERTGAGVQSWTADGFTLGSGEPSNDSGDNYISWNFKAGGPAVTNNDGSIPTQVSANPTSGFSIVSWTADGQIATLGHGLGQVPSLIICKKRSTDGDPWITWVDGFSSDEYILLNTFGAKTSAPGFWGSTPNSTTFSVTGNGFAAGTAIAYCFTNTEMLQVGSYVGNGLADGPMVSLPFKPAYFMVKATSSDQEWTVWDNARSPYNLSSKVLYPDLNVVEGDFASLGVDLLSNGVKIRGDHPYTNISGIKYLYLSISDQSFKHSRGR